MKELDKTKSYYLGDLSEEQRKELHNYLKSKFSNWDSSNSIMYDYVYFRGTWYQWKDLINFESKVVNALELFYTLENVQVDCRELSEEQIKSMCKVYESNGYEKWDKIDEYKFSQNMYFLSYDEECGSKGYYYHAKQNRKHIITYDKFMELFSKEEESILTEIMKDEYKPTFCDEVKSNKPQHYSKGIDTFKRMEENCTLEERLAFAKGNIDKYTWRTKGQDKEDFVKIVKYAEWAIKQLENEQSTK